MEELVQLNIKVPKDLWLRLREIAVITDLTQAQIVRRSLTHTLLEIEKGNLDISISTIATIKSPVSDYKELQAA